MIKENMKLVKYTIPVVAALAACLNQPSQYSVDMQSCVPQSQTCEQLIACRKRVAEANGDTFNAHCTDAGAPEGGSK